MAATEDIIESVGTKLSLSANKPATQDAAGYAGAGVTYTEIGFLMDVGEHGPESSVQTVPLLSGIVRKRKGATNYGQLPTSVAFVPGDEGQVLCRTAQADRAPYAVKLELPDGTIEYFMGLVTSFKVNPGNSESTVMGTIGIEVDSPSVWVDPV